MDFGKLLYLGGVYDLLWGGVEGHYTDFITDNKLVIITGNKKIHFDLLKNVDNNLKYKINYIIKYCEFLVTSLFLTCSKG